MKSTSTCILESDRPDSLTAHKTHRTDGCPAFLTPVYKRPDLKALPENLDDYDTIFLTGTPELLTRYAEMVPPVDEPKQLHHNKRRKTI